MYVYIDYGDFEYTLIEYDPVKSAMLRRPDGKRIEINIENILFSTRPIDVDNRIKNILIKYSAVANKMDKTISGITKKLIKDIFSTRI